MHRNPAKGRPLAGTEFFALLLFLLGASLGNVLRAGPRLRIENPQWDLGEMRVGQKSEHAFELKNAGDAPLVIDQVRSSCGSCTQSSLSSKTLAPGQTAELRVTYEARRGRTGRSSSFLTIHSNDPEAPFQRVRVSATLPADRTEDTLAVAPIPVDVGVIWQDQVREFTLEVRNGGGAAVAISKLETTRGLQKVGEAPTIGPRATVPLTFRLRRENLRGLVQEWIRIYTGDTGLPAVRVPVLGYAAEERMPRRPAGLVIEPSAAPGTASGQAKPMEVKCIVTNHLAGRATVSDPQQPGGAGRERRSVELAQGETIEFAVVPTRSGTGGHRAIRLEIELPVPSESAPDGK